MRGDVGGWAGRCIALLVLLTACTSQAGIDGDEGVAPAPQDPTFVAAVAAIEDGAGVAVTGAQSTLQVSFERDPADAPLALGALLDAVRTQRRQWDALTVPDPFLEPTERVRSALLRHERALAAALDALGTERAEAALAELADASADAHTTRALLAEQLARDD